MIKFDNEPASFHPPSLNFERKYSNALLIFDDETWEEIILKEGFKNARSKDGRIYDNFYEYDHDILLVYPNTGAPAAVIDFELLIASGLKKYVAFGTCGVFDANIAKNSIIIPTFAIREEGTSYHYLPASENLRFSDEQVEEMLICAQKYDIASHEGGIWTTDAVYRETEGKIKAMQKRGCIGVDMELSALMAVARYRGAKFAQFMLVDDLVPHCSVNRETERRDNQKYLQLALDILKNL